MAKYLDSVGLGYLWSKLKDYFVKKEDGKGLSEKDFTAAYETKLKGLENYELKPATNAVIGGVKPGAGLQVAEDGTLKVIAEDIEAGSVAWENINDKPTFHKVATSGKYEDLTGTPTLATVATSGKYEDLTGKPELADVATSGLYSDLTGAPELHEVATSGDYEDLDNKPDIDGKITSATSGFKTETQIKQIIEGYKYQTAEDVEGAIDDAIDELLGESGDLDTKLESYVTKTELEGKKYQNDTQVSGAITSALADYSTTSEVQGMISSAGHLKREVLTGALPEVDTANVDTIYMKPESGATGQNIFTEWMVINGKWEKIGSTDVDLSNYLQKSEVTAILVTEIDEMIED